MEQFDRFCQSVCRQVRFATAEERNSIRRELQEHLEDRAESLEGDGMAAEQAAEAAVAAMGDPVTIGRAMNRQYPLRWRILLGAANVAAVLLCLTLLLNLGGVYGICSHLRCRFFPQSGSVFLSGKVPTESADLRWELGGSVLRLYGTELTPVSAAGQQHVRLYFCVYSKNPFRYASEELLGGLTLLDSEGSVLAESFGGGSGNVYGWYNGLSFTLPADEKQVFVSYDRHGQQLHGVIDLTGEEVAS